MGIFSWKQGLNCKECGKFLDTGASMVAIGKVPPIDNMGRFDVAIQKIGYVLCENCFKKLSDDSNCWPFLPRRDQKRGLGSLAAKTSIDPKA